MIEYGTDLLDAIYVEDDALVKRLLKKGKCDINLPIGKFTALTAAGGKSSPSIIQILIDHGADVNLPNLIGSTPLMEACVFGVEVNAELLLGQGADATFSPRTSSCPLSAVLSNTKDHYRLFQLLLSNGANANHVYTSQSGNLVDSILMRAAAIGTSQDIVQLCASGA
ncbi:MAG: ankyrin repeat domain-containing protein, partial [Gemmataceae bacterium]